MDGYKEVIDTYRENLKRIGYNDYEAELTVAGLMTGIKIGLVNEDKEAIFGLIKL